MIKQIVMISLMNFMNVIAIPISLNSKEEDIECCISCGYQYCPELNECVRVWETYCQSLMIDH